ncbi:MAG: DUF3667 domain-containing protein [Brevundimonas sp.]|uniref:DUF3667 domain-containing protein n=1 Tax=Brevundimonas sp. TaxID=1871086 RepID=UPI00248960D8|nr:DUF3667 domain-containing protein [Brevundimonas sp.]MDI1326359.1 DUF3667 domain-containing protein [Brevundimonas sp.]
MAEHREPSAACPACGVALLGRYCHGCGQDTEARPRPLREWAAEAFSESSLVDGRTARTLAALATRPNRLLEAYRDGAGGRYQSPTKIFVVVTALFLLILNFSGVVIYQYVARVIDPTAPVTARADPDGVTVHLTNVDQGEWWMQRRVEPPVDPAVTVAVAAAAAAAANERDRQNLLYENQSNREQVVISERLAAWLPNAIWLLMPLFALLLAPLFGRRRLLMEHLVFAMWAHFMAFGLLILLALANKAGAAWPAWPVMFPYLGYFVAAARHYYGLSWWSALWRGGAHLLLYVFLVLTPATFVVAATALDMDALGAFLRAG